MEQPLVSVIIPVYNMERYLERCLDSVLNNTYRNLEVICIDDGSKDSSLEILRRYEAADPRVVVIAKENGGVSSARNAGLDRMTGEYVAFIDPDDFVHPQYIEQFVITQRETGADLVIGGFLGVADDQLPLDMKPVLLESIQRRKADCVTVFKNHFMASYCWGRLIGANLVHGIRFPIHVDYSEDSLFFSSLWERTQNINCWVLDSHLYYYYKRSDSVTNVVSCERRLEIIKLFFREAARKPEHKRIWLSCAMGRSVQSLRYYENTLHDLDAAAKIAREMRIHVPTILFSDLFTFREKMYYTVKAFFPHLRSLKSMLSGKNSC